MILHVFERWRWSPIQQTKSPHRCWVGKLFPKRLDNRFKKLFLVCFWNSTHRILFYSSTFQFSPQQSGEFLFGPCISQHISSRLPAIRLTWIPASSRDTVDWNLAEGDVSSKRVHCDPWKMGIHTRILGKHQSRKSIAQTNKHQICFMSGSYEEIQWSVL